MTLIVVVVVFIITQTPALITQVLQGFLHTDHTCPLPFFYYERISDLLIVANSSLNFIIYCFCSRRFRQVLRSLVCNRVTEESVSMLQAMDSWRVRQLTFRSHSPRVEEGNQLEMGTNRKEVVYRTESKVKRQSSLL